VHTNIGSRIDQDRRTPNGAGPVRGVDLFRPSTAWGATEKKEIQKAIGAGRLAWTLHAKGKSLITVKRTSMRSIAYCPLCFHTSIYHGALLRGRYMAAAAAMEHTSVPIDVPTLELLRMSWTNIQDDLIAAIDKDYGVFDGRTFQGPIVGSKYLLSRGIPWPTTEKPARCSFGRQYISADGEGLPGGFNRCGSFAAPFQSCGLNDLAVGQDHRNRNHLVCVQIPHGKKPALKYQVHFWSECLAAGLDQNRRQGYAVAYVDWSQQEFCDRCCIIQ